MREIIKNIELKFIQNSRGEKAPKIIINEKYWAAAPSGKSKGKYEAKVYSLSKVKKDFSILKGKLIGLNDFREVDKILENGKISGDLSIAVSMAVIRMQSDNKIFEFLNSEARTFPYPLSNIIGGGAHGGNTDIQEFLVFPKKAKNIREAVKTNYKIWEEAGKNLDRKKNGRNDENAWTTKLNDLESLEFLSEIARKHKACLGMDMAASGFYKNGKYVYKKLGMKLDAGEQLEFVKNLIKSYKLKYIEDPFHENDFKSFSELRRKVGCLVVGDDLFATNPIRLKRGLRACNGIIIKPNQAGTVSKTLETIKIAKRAGMKIIVSHRSGETLDSFISDLSVGVSANLLKCSIYGEEREAKYKRLEEIWDMVGKARMGRI